MTSHHEVNSNPPSGQSKDVDNSLREQLQSTLIWHGKSASKALLDELMSLATTYIEAAEIEARGDELSKVAICVTQADTYRRLDLRMRELQAQKAVLEEK